MRLISYLVGLCVSSLVYVLMCLTVHASGVALSHYIPVCESCMNPIMNGAVLFIIAGFLYLAYVPEHWAIKSLCPLWVAAGIGGTMLLILLAIKYGVPQPVDAHEVGGLFYLLHIPSMVVHVVLMIYMVIAVPLIQIFTILMALVVIQDWRSKSVALNGAPSS